MVAVVGDGAVVVGELLPAGGLVVDEVVIQVVAAGHPPKGLVVAGIAAGGHGYLCQLGDRGSGTALEVVAHHVDLSTARATVAAVGVVDHAVAEVDVLGLQGVLPVVLAVELVAGVAAPVVACAVEAGRAVVHVANHVVVERGELAAPNAAIAVGTLAVACIVQAFADGTPLHGEVVVVVERGHFVDAPRERAVVEHHEGLLSLPQGIGTLVDILLLAATETDEADDVVGTRAHGVVAQGDAGVGSRLSEDGDVVLDGEVALQGDDTAHVEDHDAVLRADCLAQRACAGVVQVSHVDDRSTTSPRCVATVPLGSGEGWSACLCLCCQYEGSGSECQ